MNTYVKTILTCVMCSILLLAHSQEFHADEYEAYPDSLVTPDVYVSEDDRNYVKATAGGVGWYTYYMQCRFYFQNPLPANSTVNFSFTLHEKFLTEFNVEFLRCHVLSSGSVLKNVSSGYYDFRQPYSQYYDVQSLDIDFGGLATSTVNCITLYFKITVPYQGSNVVPELFHLNYSVPDKIDQIITPTPEDQENVNNSNNDMNDNINEMDSMISDMNSVPEPNVDDLTANLDKYLPTEHITTFSSVLSALFQNEIVIAYVMIGLVVALVSFVLFGKKG